MKSTVLAFNTDGRKMKTLSVAALRLGAGVRVVRPEQYALTLGELYDGETREAAGESVGEMLVFCGFNDAALDRLLNELRRGKAIIPLKAVLTDTNAAWTPARLYTELSAEREAIRSGGKAHG